MLKSNGRIRIENNGENSGFMVGINSGTINNYFQQSTRISSHMAVIVRSLGSISFIPENDNYKQEHAFKPEEKLAYNCVIKYKEIINGYSIYYNDCNDAINLYDDSNIGSKNRILLWIKTCYLKFKGELLKTKNDDELEIDIVKKNADFLIDQVIQNVKDIITQSIDSDTTIQEDLDLGIYCFICYCFMKCKILEKPA